MKRLLILLGIGAWLALNATAQAQQCGDFRKGDKIQRGKAYHNGNKINTVFYNYGLVGNVGEISGEWPIGTGNEYVGDVSPLAGIEYLIRRPEGGVIDTIHSVLTSDGPRGNTDGPPGGGEQWVFEPLPDYADDRLETKTVATSTALDNDGPDGEPNSEDDDGKPDSWPIFWPDHPDWVTEIRKPDGTTVTVPEWNGYFGRGVKSADQESYFRFDDSNDREFPIYPVPTDTIRRGLGFEVKARGLQWSHFLAEDCIFWLYEVINEGQINYEKAAFGMVVGTLSGGRSDSRDDLAYFDLQNDITYSWDSDDRGSPGWVPVSETHNVGYVGYAFLESPGDEFDGVDNDGDSDSLSTAPRFERTDFIVPEAGDLSPLINSGDCIVKITIIPAVDGTRYVREAVTVPNQPFEFTSMGISYQITPGQTRRPIEDVRDGIDNDFDGLINENYQVHYNQRVNPPVQLGIPPQPALRYINYCTGAGQTDDLIDESRSDGVDNDLDWNISTDDVGADGKPGTNDPGEGDGFPTQGEPHFDQTDVDESDQIGLTSFDYFSPPGQVRMNNDNALWERLTPGFFDVIPGIAEDGDFVYGTGQFPIPACNTQYLSIGLMYGEDFNDILNNKQTVQTIYDENYNFARPPDKPTLKAVAGDKQVTLYWDTAAESSFDPVFGYDFEGYKIYRSTDPAFNEINTITDGFGRKIFYEPIAVFDLNDDQSGFFPLDFQGAQYYLGNNSGLRNSYVDTEVKNGFTYYYAVTAFDKGAVEKAIYPAETTKSILRDQSGRITLDLNTAVATPNPAVDGYQAPSGSETLTHSTGYATGDVFLTLLDPTVIPDNHQYRVTFEDSSWFQRQTVAYSVINTTTGDTVINKSDKLSGESDIFEGMRLSFRNDRQLTLDPENSGWATTEDRVTFRLGITNIGSTFKGQTTAYNYKFEVFDAVVDTSIRLVPTGFPPQPAIPAKPIKFKIRNTITNRDLKVVYVDGGAIDTLSGGDRVIFLEPDANGQNAPTWTLFLDGTAVALRPRTGDVLNLATFKPFNNGDVYTFTTQSAKVDPGQADLDRVKVVPNPYVATAAWEQDDPYNNGRGERKIRFVNVPKDAIVRIYTVRGELVQTLRHSGDMFDGTIEWDLRTKDSLNASYGLYVYHIEAPGVGEKVDKFAIIK